MESQKVNIATLVDNSRLGLFQWTTFILCGLCLIMDGFDVQAMGYVAPAVIKEFKIPERRWVWFSARRSWESCWDRSCSACCPTESGGVRF